MSHAVLAMGAAAVTLSGAVWYLPALSDLRAGADRPGSVRTAAAACVTGWGTAALLTVLLLTGVMWQVLAVTVVLGAVAVGLLRVRAWRHRRREQREQAGWWAALRCVEAPRDDGRSRRTVAAWTLSAAVTASAAAGAVLLAGVPDHLLSAGVVVVALATAGVCLCVATVPVRAVTRRSDAGPR